MGIDYYSCKSCGEGFPDCGDYVSCDCGENWCCDDCADGDGFQQEEEGFTRKGSTWSQDTSCNFCREEDFEDYVLLSFALDKLALSKNELIELYKKEK